MTTPADPPPPRNTNTDLTPLLASERERVIARLSECFARDELSLGEYEHRLSLAYGAQTRAELDPIGSDLPSTPGADPELAALPLEVKSILSSIVRSGPATLPKRGRMRSWAGNIQIDLRGSHVQPGVTEIEIDVFLGNLEITLPRHVHVDDQTSVMLSSFDNPRARGAPEALPPGVPPTVVRLLGRVILGNLSVRFR